jgi:sulfatase maturation enzyme AslB (radical SAM superfamily)
MNTCYDAFKNINIVNNGNQLAISPCCVSPAKAIDKIDFKNDSYLIQIREEWNLGKFPSACNNCKKNESLGMVSRRQGSTQWYTDHNSDNTDIDLISLDYWTGDLCNLACVICGPNNSSQWKQELSIPNHSRHVVVNKFWRSLDLTTLKFIHFNGGEPLLSKEHIAFLKEIPNKGQVHINYNTNATVLPDQNLLDLWSEFQLVQLDFSIDDIGERFEYQRYPAKWNKVVDNLRWFIDHAPHNCMFAINTSVGILNHANVDNLTQWLKENFHTTRFSDSIEHRQQLVLGIFRLGGPKKQAIEFLDACDYRRGTNWKKTFPELVDTVF